MAPVPDLGNWNIDGNHGRGDQRGNSVVRCRYKGIARMQNSVEIMVHPDWELTEERVLAIAAAAPWLVPPLTKG